MPAQPQEDWGGQFCVDRQMPTRSRGSRQDKACGHAGLGEGSRLGLSPLSPLASAHPGPHTWQTWVLWDPQAPWTPRLKVWSVCQACPSSLAVSAPQHPPPAPRALKANSSLISHCRLCCDGTVWLGSQALSLCSACSTACGPGTLPLAPSFMLFLSRPLSAPRSWLPWQRCSGYQVAAGGRALPQPPPFPMPGTREAQGWGSFRGALGASPGLAGRWEVGRGEGHVWERECSMGGSGGWGVARWGYRGGGGEDERWEVKVN